MGHCVTLACVDNEKRDEPFFASFEELMTSPLIGGDNIAYLYQQQQLWQDECTFRSDKFSLEQAVAMIAVEAERPENSRDSPFSKLRQSSQLSLWHSTCVLFTSLLMGRSLTGTPTESSSSSDAKADEKATTTDDGA
jgi:hypothetical protein